MSAIQLIGAALVAIPAVYGILTLVSGWFKTPLVTKEQDRADDVRKETDKFRETGRPQ